MPNNSNLTTQDFLNLSDESYANMSFAAGQANGWTVIGQTQNEDTGYAAVAYKSPEGEIIISHRGSDTNIRDRDRSSEDPAVGNPIKDWTESNMAIGRGEVPPQYHDADAFAKSIMNDYGSDVIHTGHSLGGALAQLAAHQNGGKSVTFDQPGIGEVIRNNDIFHDDVNHEYHESLIVKNSVGGIGEQIGIPTKIDLNPEDTSLNFGGHSLTSIQEAIGIDGEPSPDYILNMSTITESNLNENIDIANDIVDFIGQETVETGLEGLANAYDNVLDVKDNIVEIKDNVIDSVEDFVGDVTSSVQNGLNQVVTMAMGEEDSPETTTMMVGEEDGSPEVTTMAMGEEEDSPEMTTMMVGEEDGSLEVVEDQEEFGQPIPSDEPVENIASDLEANMNLLYENMNKFTNLIEGI